LPGLDLTDYVSDFELRSAQPVAAGRVFPIDCARRPFAGIVMKGEGRGKRSTECAPGKAAIDRQLLKFAATGSRLVVVRGRFLVE
jgi:hypothetical protein